MVLHALSRPVTPFAILSRRGLSPPLHLHENRPMKRAGEAGKALRAAVKYLFNDIQFRGLSASLRCVGSRECQWMVRCCSGA
ncbi:TPA: hypothetical protein MH415_22625 [Klebsiella pneumoniae]|nr:hypothetical protein [Klebsiella pneumoniae]HBY0307264.1 hypothetical protein [Klebsiella pneumoniae subsp. pneumoniae]MBZ6657313.1 hypothetical protein [Klebsiella pneumoniae]RRF68170.1 hypothetical protein EAO26_02675 [Klebsiella pneumoniae]HBX5337643.1 hypothetical protein [Klebsiella pneumoniae]